MRISRVFSFVFLAFILSVFAACSNDWTPEGDRFVPSNANKIELTRAEQVVAARDLDFGISLFKDIAKIEGTDKDLLISPFSASLAFSMLSAGANGKTREQLVNGLGFRGLKYADMASYYKKLSYGMVAADEKVMLSLANAIWAYCPLKEDYVTEAKASYNAEVSFLDFADAVKAAKVINDWTSDKTNGMIDGIVRADDVKDAAFVIENALYFKSEWTYKDFGTLDGEFSCKDGKKEKCKFFSYDLATSMLSLFSDDVSVLKIPYESGAFNFMVVLPPVGKDIDKFISSITGENWYKWSTDCKLNIVHFIVPCFESECTMEDSFVSAIKNRGIELPFDPLKADFSNMSTVPLLYVSKAIQKTAIIVSEKGTEASAATAIVGRVGAAFGDSPKPKYFIADRPFLYAIEEASTGTLLFIGAHVK